MKDIECSNLISTRYLSEIDEFLVSTLNSCPSFASSVFMVLRLSGALVVHHPNDTFMMLRVLWLYMGLSSVSSMTIVTRGSSVHSFSRFWHLKMKPCCSISCRTPNVRSITQWIIEHTTPLPSVVFHIFSLVGCHILLEYTTGHANLNIGLGYGGRGNQKV